MLFAYTGAFCWAAIFVSLGYFLGEEWNHVWQMAHQTRLILVVAGIAVLLGYVVFESVRRRRRPKPA